MIPRASNSTADLVSSNTILFETCQRQTGDRHLTRGVPNSSALMRESHHIVRRYTPAQLPDPVFNNVSSADTDKRSLTINYNQVTNDPRPSYARGIGRAPARGHHQDRSHDGADHAALAGHVPVVGPRRSGHLPCKKGEAHTSRNPHRGMKS